jgi:hypothetical protein
MGDRVYKITNCNGLTGPEWDAEYSSQTEAHEALVTAMGWGTSYYLSGEFTADGATDHRGEAYAVCAYPTRAELEDDEDGSYAPRITWYVPATPGGGGATSRADAEQYIRSCAEDEGPDDYDDAAVMFTAIFGRTPTADDGDQGALWSHCCAAVRS